MRNSAFTYVIIYLFLHNLIFYEPITLQINIAHRFLPAGPFGLGAGNYGEWQGKFPRERGILARSEHFGAGHLHRYGH